MAIWRSPSTEGVVVCRAGSGDPARISVGQERLILTCLFGSGCSRTTVGQECLFLIRWRSGDRHLQRGRGSFCRWGSPDLDLFGWRAGVFPARVFFWITGFPTETRRIKFILYKWHCPLLKLFAINVIFMVNYLHNVNEFRFHPFSEEKLWKK